MSLPKTILVTPVPLTVTKADLRSVFRPFGEVKSITFPPELEHNENYVDDAFASVFVEFTSVEGSKAAFRLNGAFSLG